MSRPSNDVTADVKQGNQRHDSIQAEMENVEEDDEEESIVEGNDDDDEEGMAYLTTLPRLTKRSNRRKTKEGFATLQFR